MVGGVQVALLLEGMQRAVADPGRAPRTLSAHLLRRARPGEAEVRGAVLRAGRQLSHAEAELHGASGLLARAMGSFAPPRDRVDLDRGPQLPEAPAWRALEQSQHGERPPVFTRHLEFRDCFGSPYTGAVDAVVGGWGRLRAAAGPMTPHHIAVLLDAWPPAVLACYRQMVPAATVDLSVHFHAAARLPDGPAADAPVLYRAECAAISDGYAEERAAMWAQDGRLLATSRQLVALFPKTPASG